MVYPFTGDRVYIRNSWYMAAFPDELNEGPIERLIMDEPVAMFRMSDGTPAAMWGICPHRFYPLANGKVVGDSLQCNYHGFAFDGRNGSCTAVPSQDVAPPGFRQRIYPLLEHGPWLWIWMGDAASADPALLPSLEDLGAGPGWRTDHVGLLPVAGRAQLMVENVMDLTHVAFLHGTVVDGSGFLHEPLKYRELDDRIIAGRKMRIPWVPGFYDLLFKPENRFDGLHLQQNDTVYHSPGVVRTGSGVILEIDDQETVDRSVFGELRFLHLVTPETAHSCHYFSSFSRNYRLNDDELTTVMSDMDRKVRMQDVVAAGEIEKHLQCYPDLGKELLVKSDAGAILVRRRMQRELDKEAEAAA